MLRLHLNYYRIVNQELSHLANNPQSGRGPLTFLVDWDKGRKGQNPTSV